MQQIIFMPSHEQFLALYSEGKIAVVYDNYGALQAAQAGLIHPNSAYFFYLAPLAFIAGIILSFFTYWWMFIPGIFLAIFFFSQMKPSNIKALKKAVISSEQIYTLAFTRNWIIVYKL